jgi:beta-glucosidase
VRGKTAYDEGIFVGYRWFDHEKTEPLFAFGHGLSYSNFTYSDLRLTRAEDGGVMLSCRVKNTSARGGDAVIQAYLGAPEPRPAGVEFAQRSLADFKRISVPAGSSRDVQMHIAPERLRYWSIEDHAWHDARAGRRLYVGSSSRELPLSALLPDPQVRGSVP